VSDLARLTVDLVLRLGAERVVSLGCRAPQRLAELAARVPVLALDLESELAPVRALAPTVETRAWDPGGSLPSAVREAAGTSLLVCDSLLEELGDPGPVLGGLRELLDDAPAVLVSTVDRDLLPPEADGIEPRWNAEELLALLARAGLETVWTGLTDARGTLGRRAGLTCAASRNRPGDVRAALAPGPLGLGFDPAASVPRPAEPKPRICIASYEFVGPTRTGGIGTAYTSLAEALADAEHEVTVLFTGWEEAHADPFSHWVRHYRERGIDLQRLPQAAPKAIETGHRHAVRSYEAYRHLSKLERERRFDVIHFPEVLGHGYYSLCARRLGVAFENTTIAIGTHSSTSWVLEANGTVFQAIDDFADDFIERRCVEMCDVLISPSAYMLDWMRDRGWRLPERHFVQQYARSLAAEPATITAAEAPRGDDVATELVFFGRLEPRKGLRVFCDALDRLAAEHPRSKANVTFLGKRASIDGADAVDYLHGREARWPWPVKVIDDLGQPAALAYLRSPGRRLTVIPSLADNSPNTVYEALALGIPFLASRVGGTAELIDTRDLGWATFDPEADRPQFSARGTAALADRLAEALRARTLEVPRAAVAADACRNAHVYWHGAVRATPPAAEAQGAPVSVAVTEIGGEPTPADADALLFIPPGSGVTLGAIETLERAAATCDAEVIAVAVVAGEKGGDQVTRVPVGGPAIAGLLRRCFGDAAFMIRRDALDRLGGLSDEVDPADRAHHLLCRAAIAGMRIEVLPEPLVVGPPERLAPLSIVEQSHRRVAILEAYAGAPQELLADLPLLAQQLYAAAAECERQFVSLYEHRFGRLTLPIRRSVGRARRVRRALRRDRGTGHG
jgi:glycosyltransferase involved in cell wall biosynthesis